MMMLISGCATNGAIEVPVVIDTGCKWVTPIITNDFERQSLRVRTLRAILDHNDTFERNCPQEAQRFNEQRNLTTPVK